MAQSGFTPIQHYRSATPAATPSAGNLAVGELALNYADGNLFFKDTSNIVRLLASTAAATGTVSSVQASGGTTGLTFTGGPITTSGTLTLGGTLAVANGGTGATTAPNARTNLGATTVGSNFFTLANPSAVTFPRINADNSVSALDAASFRTAIGAGTGGGSVNSVDVSGGTTGLTFTGGPITSSGTITAGGTLGVANGGTGVTTSTGSGSVVLSSAPQFGTRIEITAPGTDTGTNTNLYYVGSGNFETVLAGAAIALYTGNNFARTERVRVDISGNVGIGTSTPASKLDVSGQTTTGNITVRGDGSEGGQITFGNAANSAAPVSLDVDNLGHGRLFTTTNNTNFTIGQLAGTGGVITLHTSAAERLRLDSSGNVGIGTSSPGFRLDVSGTGRITGLTQFDNDVTLNKATLNYLYFNDAIAFARNGVGERMRITSSGNVGINTASPETNLDVAGSYITRGDASGFMYFAPRFGTQAFGANYDRFEIRVDTSSQVTSLGNTHGGTGSPRALAFVAANSERMRIDTAGNVGIGTSAPSSKLEVVGPITAGDPNGVTLAMATNSAIRNTATGGNTMYFDSGVGAGSTTGDFSFRATNSFTSRMYIRGVDGNVGIGTTSPGAKLDVVGIIQSTQGFASTSSSAFEPQTSMSNNAADATGGYYIFYKGRAGATTSLNGDTLGTVLWYGRDTGNVAVATSSVSVVQTGAASAGVVPTAITFNNGNNAERMRIDSSGNVGIGTSSPASRLHVRQDLDGIIGPVIQNRNGSGSPVSAVRFVTGGLDLSDDRYAMISSDGAGSNTLKFWTSNADAPTEKMRIDASGNIGIGATSPGRRLTVSTTAAFQVARFSSTLSLNPASLDAGEVFSLEGTAAVSGLTFSAGDGRFFTIGASPNNRAYVRARALELTSTEETVIVTAASERMRIDSSGNVGIGTSSPGTGTKLNVTGRGLFTGGAVDPGDGTASGVSISYDTGGNVGHIASVQTGVTVRELRITGNPIKFFSATGTEIFNLTATGAVTSPNLADAVGYKGLPQNSQTTGYTLVLADQGKHISITTGGVTIPANGTTAFPIGTTIVVYNDSASTQTIAITTDTLRLAGTATTGTRTLAQRGLCTLVKVKATEWVATGNVT